MREIPVILTLRPLRKEPAETSQDKAQEEEAKAEAEHERRTPAVHALGIAGERACVYEFTCALVAHYTVFHAPMDAQDLHPCRKTG